jgi:adenine/guanine phosphoribosyltransferase-like PRPP-binding protein
VSFSEPPNKELGIYSYDLPTPRYKGIQNMNDFNEPGKKVFISWSQSPSKEIASSLKNWLRTLMDDVNVWVSSEDIHLGQDWRKTLRDALETSNYAVLCVTPQNVDSPWIAMETGAIAMKSEQGFFAVPVLFGLEERDLPSHLSGFQSIGASKANLIRLANEIRNHVKSRTNSTVFERRLNLHTDELLADLTKLMTKRSNPVEPRQVRAPKALSNYPCLLADVQSAPEITLPNGKYQFHVFSVGERGTLLPASLILEVKKGLAEIIKPLIDRVDSLVTIVPGGHPWALLIAGDLDLPVEIIRNAESGAEEERMVWQKSLLYERKLYFRSKRLSSAKRVIIIDDVVSSGGTVELIANELNGAAIEVVAVVAIVFKGESYKNTAEKLGVEFYSILEVDEDYIRAGPRPV